MTASQLGWDICHAKKWMHFFDALGPTQPGTVLAPKEYLQILMPDTDSKQNQQNGIFKNCLCQYMLVEKWPPQTTEM